MGKYEWYVKSRNSSARQPIGSGRKRKYKCKKCGNIFKSDVGRPRCPNVIDGKLCNHGIVYRLHATNDEELVMGRKEREIRARVKAAEVKAS